MAKRDAFVIPAGLKLSSGADGIIIENEGDIVIHSTLGQRLARVCSTAGDVVLHTDVEAGALEAAGQIVSHAKLRATTIRARGVALHGAVVAERLDTESLAELHAAADIKAIHAESVLFDGPTLVGRVIEARRSIRVGKTRIEADILMAPSVVLDPGATGKVKVLESLNDIGPHGVRGCLRLADLKDMGGNAEAFLIERGLKPMSASAGASSQAAAAAPAPSAPVPPPPVVPPVAPPAPVIAPSLTPQVTPRPLVDDQLDTAHDDLPDEPTGDPVQAEISAILERIIACYDAANLPPSLVEMRGWIARKDYTAAREGITSSWNQLLKFHAKHGLRMRPQVNSDFNTLNSIVRKL